MALFDRHIDAGFKPRVWPARVLLALWVLFLVALMVLDGSWIPAALLSATIVAVIIPILLALFSGKHLSASFDVPEQVSKGVAGECVLNVQNDALLPVWRASVPVEVSNPVTAQTTTLQLPVSLTPHGSASLPFQVKSDSCGPLALSCDGAWVQDIGGFARKRRDAHCLAHVSIPPTATAMGLNRSSAKAYDMESFTYSSDRPGDDPGETFAVREYRAGDSVRRIHWKLSGKLGTTMVRESGFPIYSSLLLLVETGWDAPGPDPASADAQMEAASSIMMSLVGMGVAFEVAFLDRSSGSFIVRRIADEPAAWDAIGMLMAAPREVVAESSVRAFLEQSEDTIWARYVYMAAGSMGSDAEMLVAQGGTLTVLRCLTPRPSEQGAGLEASASLAPSGGTVTHNDSYSEVTFYPQTWQTDLAEVAL